MYQALGNTLLNLLVSAAENCEFMIHTLSGTTSISGSVQYPLKMNLLLLNSELSNGIVQIVKVQLNEKTFKLVIEWVLESSFSNLQVHTVRFVISTI